MSLTSQSYEHLYYLCLVSISWLDFPSIVRNSFGWSQCRLCFEKPSLHLKGKTLQILFFVLSYVDVEMGETGCSDIKMVPISFLVFEASKFIFIVTLNLYLFFQFCSSCDSPSTCNTTSTSGGSSVFPIGSNAWYTVA